MKIALCGPSGSGKTTLTKFITANSELPFISNSAQDLMSEDTIQTFEEVYGFDREAGHKGVIKLGHQDHNFGKDFQLSLINERAKLITGTEKFIIDRSPVDNLAYYLLQAAQYQAESFTETMIDLAKNAVNDLDIVIFVPYIEGNEVEDNGSRIPNRYFQSLVNGVFENTINKYLKDHIKNYYVLNQWDLDWREAELRKILSFHGINR